MWIETFFGIFTTLKQKELIVALEVAKVVGNDLLKDLLMVAFRTIHFVDKVADIPLHKRLDRGCRYDTLGRGIEILYASAPAKDKELTGSIVEAVDLFSGYLFYFCKPSVDRSVWCVLAKKFRGSCVIGAKHLVELLEALFNDPYLIVCHIASVVWQGAISSIHFIYF